MRRDLGYLRGFNPWLSTGSGRHSDAAHEIRLIGCCILLNVVPKTVPLSGSSRSPLDRLSPFGRLASLEAMRLLTTVGHPQPSKVTLGTWTTSVVQPLNYNCQSAPPNPGHLRLGLHMGFFPCRSTPFARERHLGPERHILHTRNILILMPVCYLFVCKCLKSGNVIFLLTIWSQMDVNIPAMLYSLWVLRALSGRQNSRICQQTYPPPPHICRRHV